MFTVKGTLASLTVIAGKMAKRTDAAQHTDFVALDLIIAGQVRVHTQCAARDFDQRYSNTTTFHMGLFYGVLGVETRVV